MHFNFQFQFMPSDTFVGTLAGLLGQFDGWTNGRMDWGNQVEERMDAWVPPPSFGPEFFQQPLCQKAIQDTLALAHGMMSGDYRAVTAYVQDLKFFFIVGYPRSGGTYLTKARVNALGLDHRRVPSPLVHDGYPNFTPHWYEDGPRVERSFLQQGVFQLAEFFVLARLYYERHTQRAPDGTLLIPKKMYKVVDWAGSLQQLLGPGRAQYLITVRHPVPTCVSIYEKSGGLPANGRFPALAPRSAIEGMIIQDLQYMGHTLEAIAAMSYFEAVLASWRQFHLRLATCGMALNRQPASQQTVAYGKETLEAIATGFTSKTSQLEPVYIRPTAGLPDAWWDQALPEIETVRKAWAFQRLVFPQLSNT